MIKTIDGKKKFIGVSSFFLHVMAMAFMLLDHMWATVIPGHPWMTCVGRLAFPIFAFMIVEGYFHTKNLKKYVLRMGIFVVLSEVPFDMMYSGVLFYPYHQNVLFTFLLSLGLIILIEFSTRWKRRHLAWTLLISFFGTLIAFLIALILGFDYYGPGVLTVMTFYFFSPRRNWGYLKKEKFPKWIQLVFFQYKRIWCYILQFIVLYWINMELLGGLYYPVTIFGMDIELMQQGFALLSLIPIWLYTGYQGYHKKWFQYFCYAFYPVHCLILGLIMMLT